MKRALSALAVAVGLTASPASAATFTVDPKISETGHVNWSYAGPALGETQSLQLEYSGALNGLNIYAGGSYHWMFPVWLGPGPDDFDLWSDSDGGGTSCSESSGEFSCSHYAFPGGLDIVVDLVRRDYQKTVLGIRFKHLGPYGETCTPDGSHCNNYGWRDLGVSISAKFEGPTLPGQAFVSTSAVPEPATWAMMIAGFGLAGAGLRKSRALRRAQPALQLAS